jgi:hypothetical protein
LNPVSHRKEAISPLGANAEKRRSDIKFQIYLVPNNQTLRRQIIFTMACYIENQVIDLQQQLLQQDSLLTAVLMGALHNPTSVPDLPASPVPLEYALGESEVRGNVTRASLILIIDSLFDLLDDDDFLPCDELEQ